MDEGHWAIIFFASVFFFSLGCSIGSDYSDSWWQREGILRGYGSYCINTGEWNFNGDCDK